MASIYPLPKLFGPILLPEISFNHLNNALEALPIEFQGPLGLEFRLAEDNDQVDFNLPIYRSDALHQRLRSGVAVHDHPAWNSLQHLARQWSNPCSVVHRWVDYLYLEFDVIPEDTQGMVPCTFAAIDSPSVRGLECNSLEKRCPEMAGFTEAWALLMNCSIDSRGQERIAKCFQYALPQNRVICVGAMRSRDSYYDKARVITLIDTEQVGQYVNQIGYLGDVQTLHERLMEICNLFESKLSNQFPLTFTLNFKGSLPIDNAIGIEIIPLKNKILDRYSNIWLIANCAAEIK